MPLTFQQLCDRIVASGLISLSELAEFQQGLPADRRTRDPQTFANELRRQQKLTEYQARMIFQGQTKGLTLGEYRILDKIGSGGMGDVFKAEHRRMSRVVALKLLSENSLASSDAAKRFEREVKAAARLEHPNIVAAYDAGEADGIRFLVLQFVDGQDLKSYVRDHGPLPVQAAVDCIAQAALGLEHAHSQGVVHRDIKPANLLLDKKGVVRVLDMGLARIEEDPAQTNGDNKARLTLGNQMLGTADYMAPEQAEDTRKANAGCDVYALGCTLHYLLTGRPPYTGITVTQTVLQHQQASIPSLRTIRSEVSYELDEVFQHMLAKKPAERLGSMQEVLAALESCGVLSPSVAQAVSATRANTGLTGGSPGSGVLIGTGSSVNLQGDGSNSSGKKKSKSSATEETMAFLKKQETDVTTSQPSAPAAPQPGRVKWLLIAFLLVGLINIGLAIWWWLNRS